MVDLIGLRFSLQHLRLVGYGLLLVWGSEVVNLLSSPRLGEIGTRLHYTSQFLDLSPILLVAIGLIAFQGGLRRRPFECAVLPLLLALLPLLSALHLFLAPVSLANVVTLVQKQQQVGLDQIKTIDQQIDRAATILRESESIDALLEGLQRIPGLQVRVPPQASVTQARQEVRRSLERERDRLRERIEENLSATREAFLRRAITNALLALLVGLLLWALHHGAMREMEQAIPFLDWVLVQGEAPQQAEALQQLLRFQRACVALGWFSLLERSLRLVRRVVRRPSAEELAEAEQARQHQPPASPPPNPFERSLSGGVPRGTSPPPLFSGPRPSLFSIAALDALPAPGEPEALSPDPVSERLQRRHADSQRREERRRQRDLERYCTLRLRIEREGRDPFASFWPEELTALEGNAPDRSVPEGAARDPRERRRLEQDHRRAREALRHMSQSQEMRPFLPEEEQLQRELQQELDWQLQRHQLEPPQAPLPRRRGLAGLWNWFLTHL